MRWIRHNVRWAARLALFALAVHMAVSFGHVHVDIVAAAAASGTSAAAGDADFAATSEPARPAHPYRNSAAHDFCALCANIGLFGALILTVPSALAALRESDRIQYGYASATGIPRQPRSSFQARAPPLA
jgi:hypothetical protein